MGKVDIDNVLGKDISMQYVCNECFLHTEIDVFFSLVDKKMIV
jgi:hypothetical protein